MQDSRVKMEKALLLASLSVMSGHDPKIFMGLPQLAERVSSAPRMCTQPGKRETGPTTNQDQTDRPDTPQKFDLQSTLDTSGAGFNQFDPVLSASGFLSRRFGIAGGLGLVAILAATEGREILLAATDSGPVVADGKMVTTASGLRYMDLLVSSRGDSPLPGAVIGLNAVVYIGDQVLYDTRQDKKIAFKFGQRPFQNVVCEGVEEGLKGMKPGGKRRLFVPPELAPKGVDVPSGVSLTYDIELLEVLPGYF